MILLDILNYTLIVLSALIVIFFIFFILCGYFGASITFKRKDGPVDPKKYSDHNTFENKLDVDFYKNEEIRKKLCIKSYDGLDLFAYLYKNNSHNYMIFIHGYTGVYYEQSLLASFMYKNGYNCLCLINRGHAESGGKYITMGYQDKYDVKSWVDFIVKRDKDAKICIFGRSMGGATALMTSGLDLPKNVKTIVADSAYNSIDKQIRFTARKGIKVIPIPFIAFATYLFAKVFYKIDTKKPTSIQSVQKSNLPILLIHGTNDTFVPYEYSVEIFNSIKNDKREFKTYKDATHCGSLCRYEEDYKHTVLEFNKKYWND